MDNISKATCLVDYDVVSDIKGHDEKRGIKLVEAAKDIFHKVKEKAMQVAVKGNFIEFSSMEDLQDRLFSAVKQGVSIRVYDEDIGG